MQRIILGIVGIVSAFFILKYREKVGDTIGDADWMQKIGGVYNLMILISLFLFFWSLAFMTNTEGFLLGPIKYLIPGLASQPPPATL
ncbi:MAG: hypothetical protein JWM56_1126 [Candidatus Peribacteria bacterium]|nr:hypothetical protein [Candidatus Peribacteria bacterium]